MPLAQSSPDRMECLKDTVIHAIIPLETYYKKGTGAWWVMISRPPPSKKVGLKRA